MGERTVDLSCFNNEWYNPGGSFLKRIAWYFVNILFFINPLFPFSSVKCFILRLFGAKIGERVVIKPHVNIKYPWKLKIGEYTWIGENVWIDNLDYVAIGKNCCISQGAMLLCGNHNYKLSSFDLIVKPIILEDGVWVGARAVVCQGVVIGAQAVLTVGSVATSCLDKNTIYQGNPAIEIRKRIIEK